MIYLAIKHHSIAHPFLLADNRHYTFYIWRYFLSKPIIRFGLTPIYFIAIWVSIRKVAERQSFLWCVLFFASVSLTLIPSPLIEFRYFIIPYFIYRLHLPKPTQSQLILEGLQYILTNLVTMYLFLYRPFQWPNETSAQRFMW